MIKLPHLFKKQVIAKDVEIIIYGVRLVAMKMAQSGFISSGIIHIHFRESIPVITRIKGLVSFLRIYFF